jgi:hypothetical protein
MKISCTLRVFLVLVYVVLTSCSLRNNIKPHVNVTSTEASSTRIVFVTETLSPTDLPIHSSSQVPVATLNSKEALNTFTSLIEKNDECKLPCWLGIVPGQTESEDVINLFSKFNAVASTKFSSQLAYIRVFFPTFEAATHDIMTNVYFGENGKVLQTLVAASTYTDKNGPLDFNNPTFQRVLQRYLVSSIFTSHGPPEMIFLDTTRITADPATRYPFVLWIVYPQQGFLIRYEGNNTEVGGDIVVCPMQSRIEIKIWDVKTFDYEEFIENDEAAGISLGPQPIQDVTEFNIGSFYETFRSVPVDTCFETPASIWPH